MSIVPQYELITVPPTKRNVLAAMVARLTSAFSRLVALLALLAAVVGGGLVALLGWHSDPVAWIIYVALLIIAILATAWYLAEREVAEKPIIRGFSIPGAPGGAGGPGGGGGGGGPGGGGGGGSANEFGSGGDGGDGGSPTVNY